MSIFYKYTSYKQARYILQNKCLTLGHFTHYNDPFECYIGDLDFDKISSLCENGNNSEFQKLVTDLYNAIAKEEGYDTEESDKTSKNLGLMCGLAGLGLGAVGLIPSYWIIAAGMALIGQVMTDKKHKISIDNLTEFLSKVVKRMSQVYTSCFTTKYDRFLMWSHYADAHNGVVLGFDSECAPFKNNPPQPMKYSSKHYVFKQEDILSQDVMKVVSQLLLLKNDEWKEEEEYRFLFDIEENEKAIIWHDHNDNPVIRLEDNAIKSVYFGTRVSPKDIDAIKKIVSVKYKDTEIALLQCKLSKINYSLEFIPISIA